jgi:hypothetical protein
MNAGSQLFLGDLHADTNVLADFSQNFVVHTEGFHPVFEGAKFIERADEIVEEDDVAGLEMAREGGENVERGAEKVRVEMDNQAAGEIAAADQGQQRILKQAGLERAARVAGFRNPAVDVERKGLKIGLSGVNGRQD